MDICFGGIYKVKKLDSQNDQQYGFVFPVRLGEDIYMIDTYYIDTPIIRRGENLQEAAIRSIIEYSEGDEKIARYLITHINSNYYYHNYAKIDSLNNYDFICDLHNMRPLNEAIEGEADFPSSGCRVILHHEQNFSWELGRTMGIVLVFKDETPDDVLTARRKCCDAICSFAHPFINGYRIREAETFMKEHGIRDEKAMRDIRYCKELRKIVEEFQEQAKELEAKYLK